ncbi:MAG: hypothetical protein MZV63_56570 [Marinilabiliales bacterium]|nr:hypothetical protein [Marinilabiliales bacterium]
MLDWLAKGVDALRVGHGQAHAAVVLAGVDQRPARGTPDLFLVGEWYQGGAGTRGAWSSPTAPG